LIHLENLKERPPSFISYHFRKLGFLLTLKDCKRGCIFPVANQYIGFISPKGFQEEALRRPPKGSALGWEESPIMPNAEQAK